MKAEPQSKYRARLERLARRLRRRRVLGRALPRGVVALAASTPLVALATWGVRTAVLPTAGLAVALGLAGFALVGALASSRWPKVADETLLLQLDREAETADTLGAARAFLRAEGAGGMPADPFEAATVARAMSLIQGRNWRPAVRRAAPFALPESVPAALVGGFLVVVAALLPPPRADAGPLVPARDTAPEPQPPAAPAPPPLDLAPADRALFERLAEDLRRSAADAQHPALAAWLEALHALAEDVAHGRVSAREAFRRLAELEAERQRLESENARDLEQTEARLGRAAEALRREALTRALGEALAAGDLKRAAAELEALAGRNLRSAERSRLRNALERAAEALQDDAARALDALRREGQRLAAREAQGRLSTAERRRLDDLRRDIAERDRAAAAGDNSPNRAGLERLQREFERVAGDLHRPERDSGAAGRKPDTQAAADELRRMAERQAAARGANEGRGRTADLRELLRQATAGQNRTAGRSGGSEGSLRDFYRLAQGDEGSDPAGATAGGRDGAERGGTEGGEAAGLGRKPCGHARGARCGCSGGGTGQAGAGATSGSGGAASGGTEAAGGDAPGTGHDPELLGRRTRPAGQAQDRRLPGGAGAPPSRARIILGAAEEGFAGGGYARVHQDYSGVVERALDRERIPPGLRGYVRRYFELIRPR